MARFGLDGYVRPPYRLRHAARMRALRLGFAAIPPSARMECQTKARQTNRMAFFMLSFLSQVLLSAAKPPHDGARQRERRKSLTSQHLICRFREVLDVLVGVLFGVRANLMDSRL